MTSSPLLAHLMFRASDGTLTLAGYWMIAIGVLMVAGGLAHVIGRVPERWLPPRFPRVLQVSFGCIGVAAGIGFVAWPLIAAPGVLY
jgi:hypothetical protein